MYQRIPEFYAGKSLLLTGATGFVGTVLLETLMRCCPGITAIYIVLRSQGDRDHNTRKQEILQKEIFNKLRKENPSVFDKVKSFGGDVSEKYLGLGPDELQVVLKEVTIVFHCAASVNFRKSPRFLLTHNAKGTQNVIELSRKLTNLDVFVYTSTAYCNSHLRTIVKEEIYRLPLPAKEIMESLSSGSDSKIREIASLCRPGFSERYSFSKCVSENLILEIASDLPVAIVRPSIVSQSWKGACPGYNDNHDAALFAITSGLAGGFLKVFPGDPDIKLDIIPVDTVANAHVIAAWSVAHRKSKSPLVVNCTAKTQTRTDNFCRTMTTGRQTKPLLQCSVRRPTTVAIETRGIAYWLRSLVSHHGPALLIDLVFRMQGRSSRVSSAYMLLERVFSTVSYYLRTDWKFERNNMEMLSAHLSTEDREILDTDLSEYSVEEIGNMPKLSNYISKWKTDKVPDIQLQRTVIRVHKFISIFQHFMIILFIWCLYYIITKTWQMYTQS